MTMNINSVPIKILWLDARAIIPVKRFKCWQPRLLSWLHS